MSASSVPGETVSGFAPISKAAKPAASRIDWVDYAKGICILLVVMMHSTLGVEKAAGTTGWLGYVVEFSKPFRMPDFFLISGLFLGLVIDRPWLRYIDRKVVHFIYFYVLWLTIQFAFKAPAMMGLSPDLPMSMIVAGFLDLGNWQTLVGNYAFAFVEPFGTLWFIYMLPVFFIVTRLGVALPWWVMLAAAALLEILPIHTGWLMVDEFASRYVYFLAGYLFAGKIFKIADWVRQNTRKAMGYLVAWALVNGTLVFAPTGDFVANVLGLDSLSHLPVISLALGGMGAVAIICLAVLLSQIRWSGFLEYLGKNSIVVYLAFFLPMAISRAILLKFAPFLDIGTVSLFVMISAALGPVILYWIIQKIDFGWFLFRRPSWAMLEKPKGMVGNSKHAQRLQAAE
jgi:uncharacterized membrane protein YcfT